MRERRKTFRELESPARDLIPPDLETELDAVKLLHRIADDDRPGAFTRLKPIRFYRDWQQAPSTPLLSAKQANPDL